MTKCLLGENRRLNCHGVETLSKTTLGYRTRQLMSGMARIKKWNMYFQNRHERRRRRWRSEGCCCLRGLLLWRWPGITPVPSHNLSLVSGAHRLAEWAQPSTSQNKSAAELPIIWGHEPKLGRRIFLSLILVNLHLLEPRNLKKHPNWTFPVLK